jgi:NTP pyrophosphatase (non-canonical NTP hydrolase)
MNFGEYQEKAREFALYEDESYPFLALAEEVGEFLSVPAKMLRGDDILKRFGTEEAIRQHVLKEAGDVLWMLAACLGELDLNLQDAAELNLTKLTDRKARGVLQGNGDNR